MILGLLYYNEENIEFTISDTASFLGVNIMDNQFPWSNTYKLINLKLHL